MFWSIHFRWQLRLCLALTLLLWFYIVLHSKVLISDTGYWLNHHAALIILVVTPYWWLQAIAVVCYVDDVFQHAWKRRVPTYESPLHRLGAPAYWLRDQIAYRLRETGRWGRVRDWLFSL